MQAILWKDRPIEGILFDMDGVIADTRAAHQKSWLEFATKEGWTIESEEFTRRTFGRGNMEILPEYYPERATDLAYIHAKSEEKETIYRRLVAAGEIGLVPGVSEFIELIAAREIPIALGSSAPKGNIACTLETFKLERHFATIVGMEDVSRAKPDPEIFLLCCNRLDLNPANCVVLEDSLHGLDAAHNAGCRAIGITTMHSAAELADHSEATAPDFHEVIRLLNLAQKAT